MMKQMKNSGQVWVLALFVILIFVFMPKDVYATQIGGGSSEEEAVEIIPNVDYVSGEDGWFQITVPKGAVFVGVYTDEYTAFDRGFYSNASNHQKDVSSEGGVYKNVNYLELGGNGCILKYRIYTTKAEQCQFKIVYGGERMNKDEAKDIVWNQEYTYLTEWEPPYDYYRERSQYKYCKFVAPKNCYVRIRYSYTGDCSWGFTSFGLRYKDGSEVKYEREDSEGFEIYYVEQGMTYYVRWSFNDVRYTNHQIKFIVEDIPVSSITLNATSLTMNRDDKYLLEPTVMPYNAVYPYVEFTSSNENVATVDKDGWITAKGNGTAVITVSALDGSGTQEKCTVKVIDVKKGSKLNINGMKYRVLSVNGTKANVELYDVADKEKVSYNVPGSFKVGQYSCKVESIASKVFYNCKKAIKITIGTNVKQIGGQAFGKCKMLKVIIIKSSKLEAVGKNAFKGIKSNAKIKVPKQKVSQYKQLFKGKGQGRKVKIVKG